MGEPVEFTPRPARTETSAREEVDRLVETLHKHGLLRLANDIAAANQGIAEVVVRGLNTEGARNAMQNVAAAAMVLGKIPPGAFYKFADALREAAAIVETHRQQPGEGSAPGIRGVYKLLNDDDLWRTLTPLVRAAGTFASALSRPAPEKPITAFSGKPSDA